MSVHEGHRQRKKEQFREHGLDAFETTLPVLYIDTGGHRITKENKIWASLAVLEKAYAGRQVVGVDARPLFARGGGIHCITQQQPRV